MAANEYCSTLAIRGEPDSYERQENAWLLEHFLKINSLELKFRLEQELTAQQEQDYWSRTYPKW